MAKRNNSRSISLNDQIAEIEHLIKTDTTLSIQEQEKLHNRAKQLADERLEEEYNKKLKYLEDEHKTKLEHLAKEGKALEVAQERALDKFKEAFSSENITKGVTSLTNDLENRMNDYLTKQQSIIAHLTGSNDSLDNVTKKMTALSATGLVEQKAVYNNLHKLITSGIVANAEQRAFLQTLSDDIDLTFNATDGTLIRLINLQRTDLTSSRMAIQYSLQTFLNQNYETSTYIKDSFTTVSNSLIEMQSLFKNASDAMSTEATIQKWLGSFSSAGGDASTVASLANAINAFGSGDVSGLGKGVSNLLLMGAARTGQDISSILNEGLNANNVDTLMSGVVSYLQEMNSYGSNVVKSQLSSLFGVKISDLVAAQNMVGNGTEGGVTSNIDTALLKNFGELVPASVRISRYFENFMNSWAMNTANNPLMYTTFKIGNVVGPVLGELLGGVEKKIGSLTFNLGNLVQSGVQLLPTVFPLIQTLGGALSSHTAANDFGSASGLYKLLFNTSKLKSSGKGFTTEGTTTSQNYVLGDLNTSELIDQAKNSAMDLGTNSFAGEETEHSLEDVYKILDSGKISILGNSLDTSLGHTELIANTSQLTDENVSLIASISKDIYELLNDHLASIDDNISLIANSSFTSSDTTGWSTTAI